MFDDGVFESYTVRADNIRIDDEVVFGFGVADSHGFIPDFFAV